MIYKHKACKFQAFTLTEILLAVAVVGVIAALVIPPTVTKFNTEVLSRGFDRQNAAIKSAVDSLVVKENVKNFSQTTMYSNGTESVDNTSGKFMKRYLRVSKYYGDANANKDLIKKECFANKYYEYADKSKKEFTIDSKLVGACAKLKNGASICLAPQVGATTSVQGVMDINGPKGPNVYGKDLREIKLGALAFVTRESEVGSSSSVEVETVANPNVGDTGYEDLCSGDYSVDCCNYHYEQGSITSPSHACCSNAAVASTYPACSNEIVLHLNFYPTPDCTYSQWSSGACRPYISDSNSYAHKKGDSTHLTSLPAAPPPLNFYCDGILAGNMFSNNVKSAVISPSGYTYVSQLFYVTSSPTYSVIQSKKCDYDSSSKGIVSGQGSFAFSNGQDSIVHNGITWWVEKY